MQYLQTGRDIARLSESMIHDFGVPFATPALLPPPSRAHPAVRVSSPQIPGPPPGEWSRRVSDGAHGGPTSRLFTWEPLTVQPPGKGGVYGKGDDVYRTYNFFIFLLYKRI